MNIENEIIDFKNSLIKNYKQNDKHLIYLRVSELDRDNENPLQEALEKLRSDFNSILYKYPILKKEGFLLFVEIKSAYKNTTREEFVKLYENYLFKNISIKDVLENNKVEKEEKNLYVSSYDRISRVFFYSLIFQLIRKISNIKIWSLIESENTAEISSQDIQSKDNTQQLMYVFQLMMSSSMASKHSEDMSNKIKKRVAKKNGVTISNKTGLRWGRNETISKSMRKRIIERSKSFSYKEISEQHDIYQTKDNKRTSISPHTIRKIIGEAK